MQWSWTLDGWIVLTGVLSAASCALLGNYLVLRRLSLMGDAISHAVLPGLAIAFIIAESRSSLPMFIGAVLVGVLTALLTQVITRHGKVEHGAAMGVVFTILFAVGLLLIRRAADHVDLDPGCVLYGSLESVPLDAIGGELPPAVRNLSIVLVANIVFVLLFFKELRIAAFDPELATTLGINAQVMHYALMVMVAVTTVANFEAVGSILVIAMLIVPGVAAHLLTDRFGVMIALSLLVAIVSAVAGHLLAAFGPGLLGAANVSANTAAMMTVVAGLILLLAIFAAPQYGLISRVIHRLQLVLQITRQDILGLLYRWHELQPAHDRPMPQQDLLAAIGDHWTARLALRRLRRSGAIETPGINGNRAVRLTPAGRNDASRLVGAHRLWEAYLAKHFDLAPDHLHEPAERMEHFITPELSEALRKQLTDPSHDPHGRPIPTPSQAPDELPNE